MLVSIDPFSPEKQHHSWVPPSRQTTTTSRRLVLVSLELIASLGLLSALSWTLVTVPSLEGSVSLRFEIVYMLTMLADCKAYECSQRGHDSTAKGDSVLCRHHCRTDAFDDHPGHRSLVRTSIPCALGVHQLMSVIGPHGSAKTILAGSVFPVSLLIVSRSLLHSSQKACQLRSLPVSPSPPT